MIVVLEFNLLQFMQEHIFHETYGVSQVDCHMFFCAILLPVHIIVTALSILHLLTPDMAQNGEGNSREEVYSVEQLVKSRVV